MIGMQQTYPWPPDFYTIKSLNNAAKIVSLIFGTIMIVLGAIMMIFLSGWVFLIFGIFNLVIYYQIKSIDNFLNQQRFFEAKNETLVWAIVGLILSGVVVGIILFIAYFKYDDLLKIYPGIPPFQ
ncbi:MAG: hypothetical protein ACP5TO_03050 [Thermoplasmata archaeon]